MAGHSFGNLEGPVGTVTIEQQGSRLKWKPVGAKNLTMKRSDMWTVCVFAGSSPGARSVYSESAKTLGQRLVKRGIGLVYGGAKIGLMGTLADTVLTGGGHATGVIPRHLVHQEIVHQQLTKLHVVETMHERKAKMSELADCFIALPGGLGTLDELFEVLTLAQLGIHVKPCGILNIDQFFDKMVSAIDHAITEQFIGSEYRQKIIIDSDVDRLLDRLSTSIT